MKKLTLSGCALGVLVLLLLPCGTAFAQAVDPMVGTWNMNGANSDGSDPFIAIMTFNQGGTTVETDTAGFNSSASPGESINLGKWAKTGNRTYSFKDQNYIYDSSGNLADIAIASCSLKLDASLNNFTGPCEFNFYTCSVTSCPGTFVAGGPASVSGKRF